MTTEIEVPNRYLVELRSPTNDQRRRMHVTAADADEARSIAEESEQGYVNFSLMPPDKEVWEDPINRHGEEHAVVDLSRWDAIPRGAGRQRWHNAFADEAAAQTSYADAVRLAKGRIDAWKSNTSFKNGKVVNTSIDTHSIGRLLAHDQHDPYEIQSIDELPARSVEAIYLIEEIKNLKGDPQAWDKLLDWMSANGFDLGAVSATLYGLTAQGTIDGSLAFTWSSDTIKFALHTNTYSPNQDTDDFFNDATNEVSGTGYTGGGVTAASKASTYDTASDQVRLDAADASWTSSTLTARRLTEYKSTGTGSTSPLVGWVDFGADVSTTNGTFSVVWDATGIDVYDVT